MIPKGNPINYQQVILMNGEFYMDESSKYGSFEMHNDRSNVSVENQGEITQSMTNISSGIQTAFDDLNKAIQSITDESKRELAESNAELLENYVESKNKEKAAKPLLKLRGILGDISALVTIGTFIASF